MLRHKWGKLEKTSITELQQCIKCELYRFKAMGIWMYSKQKSTDQNPLIEQIPNYGCKK